MQALLKHLQVEAIESEESFILNKRLDGQSCA